MNEFRNPTVPENDGEPPNRDWQAFRLNTDFVISEDIGPDPVKTESSGKPEPPANRLPDQVGAGQSGHLQKRGNVPVSHREQQSPRKKIPPGERPVTPVSHKRKKRRKGCLSSVIWTAVIAVLSVGFALAIIFAAVDVFGIGKDENVIQFTIPEGTASEPVDFPALLQEQGFINYPFLFKLFVKLKGVDTSDFKPGLHSLKKSSGYDAIIRELKESGLSAETVTVRIKEGSTVEDIIKELDNAGVCSRDAFFEACKAKVSYDDVDFVKDIPVAMVKYRFEGYLYPDTYEFFTNKTTGAAKLAIDKMLKRTQEFLTSAVISKGRELGYKNAHEILAMASLIQAECNGYPHDMPGVSMVFLNRLRWETEPNYLGSTPTAEYLKGSSENVKYNTNPEGGKPGLPIGPICAPTADAINAVISPDEAHKDDYYFLTDSDFHFYYNKTYSAHKAEEQRLKNAGKWAG